MDDFENPPKFTVQQIILLQKLVESGLTKDQIIAGVEDLEKHGVGREGGRTSGTPTTNGQNSGAKESEKSSSDQISRCHSPYQVPGNTSFPAHLSQGNSLVYQQSLRNPTHHLPSLLPQVGAAAWSNPTQAVAATLLQNGFGNNPQSAAYTNLIASRGFLRRGSDGGAACLPNSAPNGMSMDRDNDQQQQQQQFQADMNEELEDLFRQDPAVVKEEIRKFISERHISQSAIAKATRNAISQSYISQWLAQPQDISGQKKRTMYSWYITEKRKYASGIGGPLSGVQQQLLFRGATTDNDVEHSSLLKSKRGSRFTWPKECVSVLEQFYVSNNYPDESKREEIAQSCNVIIQSHKPVRTNE